MHAALLANLTDLFNVVWTYLAEPLRATPWGDWRDFWLSRTLDDRFVVVYFLPLVGVLWLFRGARLRLAIVFTGLTFMAYVFGVVYAGVWLVTAFAFHAFGERFARELQRTDVWRGGPPVAAWLIVGGWYILTMGLHKLELPEEFNRWLFEHARWAFPLGVRGLPWEPTFQVLLYRGQPDAPQFIYTLFWDIHNIGTAYLAVRMLQYLAEIRRGTIAPARRTRLNFMAFVGYAPALIQGPIERYESFQAEMDACHLRRSGLNVAHGLVRITWGVTKALIADWYFLPLLSGPMGMGTALYYASPERIESFWVLYFGVFFQIYYLYLQFSGYCDVAIGMSRMFGYRQAENFNWTWFATSLRDFWRRWHITLSLIIRDYIYIPLGGNRRHVTLNLCITFALVGIWHRLMINLFAWGVLMGLMLAINRWWVIWMERLDARPTGAVPAIRRMFLRLQPLPTILAWVVTYHAFVFSLAIFFGGIGGLKVLAEILRRVWAAVS